MSTPKYVPVVITTPAASAEAMNQLIAATGAEGATDNSLGAPVWDESTPIVLGADGWPNLAVMPAPDFLVTEGFLHVDAAAQLPEDEPGQEAP
jgi:hypothetical protein